MKLGTDARGNYKKFVQGKTFYLGDDEAEAQVRAIRLGQMWEAIKDGGWTEEYHRIALAVARGEQEIVVPDAYLGAAITAQRIANLQEKFPFLRFVPTKSAVGVLVPDELKSEAVRLRQEANVYEHGRASGVGLHAAIEQFVEEDLKLSKEPGTNQVTATALRYIRNMKILKEHHADLPMADLKLKQIDQIIAYWRNRPVVKRTGKPAAKDTCREQIKLFRRFLRWAVRADLWEQPKGYFVAHARIPTLPEERERKATAEQVQRYTRDELVILWKYAKPLERLFMALALNCGFGAREITTLRRAEILSEDKIGRIRTKSEVYGQWKLWDVTQAGLEWYRREKRPESYAPEFFMSRNGVPYARPTKGGNRNMTVANAWGRLLDRVQKDHPKFRRLSFNKLRKTAANLVRRASKSGEIAGTFLCHGKPVKGDVLSEVYSNRLFKDVFRALRRVRRHLELVFAAVSEPFPAKPGQSSLSLGKIEQIRTMRRDGFTIAKIARALKLSRETVRKYARTA